MSISSRLITEKWYSVRRTRVSQTVATLVSTGKVSPSHSISPDSRVAAPRFIDQYPKSSRCLREMRQWPSRRKSV